ncbi:MAG: lipid A phosphoethanolamine transferase [Bacteroides sp.]|nr:lipid A phosphoethanolamine transferase [Bacteroides sp.]MCM1414069.1 lipid A phosphoethanolamine transferase [Bacteroides sp.]MCM1472332.1 lipid A phosphoethanolamine transferase [Bacteroides sp.]
MNRTTTSNSGCHRILYVLFAWTFLAVIVPNVWLSLTEHMSVVQSLTNIILPGGVYLLLMSLTPRIGRTTLWMIILFVFAAFQMVLLYMYGRSPIAVDMFLNVVTTNPGEVQELLGNMMTIMGAIFIIYLPPIIAGIWVSVRGLRLPVEFIRRTRRSAYAVIICGLALFGLSFTSHRPYHPHCDIYPVNIFYNLGTAVHRTIRVANYHETSRDYRYDAVSTRPDTITEIYVVVIGETSRADNWEIFGYNRPTNPRLKAVDGLYDFPRTISQSNTTHKSVPMLLSPLDASNFGDSIYYTKSLITAFKEAGFKTAFYSAHSRNHSFIDFFGEEADTCFFIKEDGEQKAHYYDKDLLAYLDSEIAKGNRKQLVVLHSYGSHFNYIDRYPETDACFRPDRPAGATYGYRDKQINAYDNTILYTSDFLTDVISRLQNFDGYSAMIYASDHGEDIFDDERHLFLHASPVASYYQVHVPMLVWVNPALATAYPQMVEALRGNRMKFVASSKTFFHTLMELSGLQTPRFKRSESLADKSYTPSEAIYLNDHNDGVKLRESGILHYDIERLDSLLR